MGLCQEAQTGGGTQILSIYCKSSSKGAFCIGSLRDFHPIPTLPLTSFGATSVSDGIFPNNRVEKKSADNDIVSSSSDESLPVESNGEGLPPRMLQVGCFLKFGQIGGSGTNLMSALIPPIAKGALTAC